MKPILILAFLMLLANACSGERQNESGSDRLFDGGWLFFRGDPEGGENPGLDESSWRMVNLPHDWSIEDIPGTQSPFDSTVVNGVASGFTRGGTGWYRKHFRLNPEEQGKRITILFEGIYMESDIWVNGNQVGGHFYGYSSFCYDISDFVRFDGDNLIAVRVRNEGIRCRWYTGSGIYRHVWLSASDPLRIDPWGVSVNATEVTPEQARVTIHTTLSNHHPDTRTGEMHIRILGPGLEEVGSGLAGFELAAGMKCEVGQEFTIQRPHLWDTQSPTLYRVEAEVIIDGKRIDRTALDFGIRSISFDTLNRFQLNGKSLELKGGCIHHDNGPLGARAFDRAEERKVDLLKAAGFNAIRFAHNPPSPAILNACDRLGMMAIVESFDVWRYGHYEDDYGSRFDSLWKADIGNMVLRDRNHPSVIMWSIGNEITSAETPEIADLCGEIAGYVRSLDPSRPVTAALNAVVDEKDPFFSHLDVCGYNYSAGRYRMDHDRLPQRVIYASESVPTAAWDYWKAVEENSWVVGDFVWTAFDYMGEASIGWRGYMLKDDFYPWNLAYCGDLDITGQRRPQSFYRQSLWDTTPFVSIFVAPPEPSFPLNPEKKEWSLWDWPDVVPCWNYSGCEERLLDVVVYTPCDQVELFLNGNSLGMQSNTLESRNELRWEVPYRAGQLKAIGYREGDKVTESVMATAGSPEMIRLSADRGTINADGQDLSFIKVEVTDASGLLNPVSGEQVFFEVTGAGELAAVGSADPTSLESFQLPQRRTWRGQCLLIVRAGNNRGELKVRAKVEGLPEAILVIKVI